MRVPSRHLKGAVLVSAAAASVGLACLAADGRATAEGLAGQLARLSLPAGFHVEVYAADVPGFNEMDANNDGQLTRS